MPTHTKLLQKILLAHSDTNIRFRELSALLRALGFEERIRGGHHIYTRHDIIEIINIQAKAGKAKAYQVKQIRTIIQKYRLRNRDAK